MDISHSAQSIAQAEEELTRLDPVLGKIIQIQKPIIYEPRSDYFFALCRSIIGQQVSVAAASSIFNRLQTKTSLSPQAVQDLKEEDCKEIGLSKQKASYIKDLAAHFVANPEVYNHLERATDEEVIAELTLIKGIGIWTAQMFLMFTLLRLDVFAPDDVGIQRAMKLLYGWESIPSKQVLLEMAENWKPFRTVACWHLWKSLNNTP